MEGAVSKFRRHYRNISVQVHLPEEALLVPMDPLLMQQVLFNLMENAARHGETVTRIELTLTRQEEQSVLEVADNGVGIAKEDLRRVFDRFYRTPDARGGEVDGHGLGLSIARMIVQAHGGRIEVQSRPGAGSRFHILLPV